MDRLEEIVEGLKKHGQSWEDAGYFLTAKGEYGPGTNVGWLIEEVKRLRTALTEIAEACELEHTTSEPEDMDCLAYVARRVLEGDQRTSEMGLRQRPTD